jgi:mono/diheme cytochrome c family protein
MNNFGVNTSQFLRVIFSSLLVASAVGALYSTTASASDAIERGTSTYLQFCGGCHGADKAGLVNFQGGLADLQAILDGETNQMPDFYGVFSEDEVADIYAFLKASD